MGWRGDIDGVGEGDGLGWGFGINETLVF
jgi:hypothetical protein